MTDQYNAIFEEAARNFDSGQYEEAKRCYRLVLGHDVNNPRALHAMGVIAYQTGDLETALDYLLLSKHVKPDYVMAYRSLGRIKRELGYLPAAKISYMRALEIEPDHNETLCNIGAICRELTQYEDAEKYLKRVLENDGSNSRAFCELGCIYHNQKRYAEAVDYLVQAIALKPDYIDACTHLSLIYLYQGRQPESQDYLNKGLEFKPDSLILRSYQAFSLNYLPGVSPADIHKACIEWARHAMTQHVTPELNFKRYPAPDKVLRIGLVSPDFRRHPVTYFIKSFMTLYDREQFEVICYSDVVHEDELTQSLIESCDVWRRVRGVKDDSLAAIIISDGIDILVDLAGHTKDSRLGVFIKKPAPLQVTWAGYVGTTGLKTIDYLISDRFQSPEGAEEYTVERIIRMPDGYISYSPPDFAPEVAPLPALKNGYITFGSFNNLAKLSDHAVSLWSDVLKSVSGAKLFIKNPSFSDQATVERYLTLFEKCGISRERILTEGQSSPQEMLERYSRIDIQLDSMPYSGGLTTLESLWMGVPVVTLPGELFSSRHSLTHLMNAGLSEFVASSREEYIEIASNLANDLGYLSELRKGMRDQVAASPVCDGFEFTTNLQCAFRSMWQEYCQATTMSEIELESSRVDIVEQIGSLCDHIEFNDRGNKHSDKGDFDAAIKCYKDALTIKSGYVEAYYNLGLVHFKKGDLDEAIRFYNYVICLCPDYAEVYVQLSYIFLISGKPGTALDTCRQGIGIIPDSSDLYNNLGSAYMRLGNSAESLAAFRKAVELRPDYHQAHSNLLHLLHCIPQMTARELYDESCMWDKLHGAVKRFSHRSRKTHEGTTLRVGLVSPDFRLHPVGYFVQAFLLLHDRNRFKLYCYSDIENEDSLTDLFRESEDNFRFVKRIDDVGLAELIYSDDIDILIDLAGHTSGNRLKVFAMKPAPVQVTWGGCDGTTGLSAIDYLISDQYHSPEGSDEFSTETIIRMPDDYICYCPPENSPNVSTLPALENGYITFGCFNDLSQISDDAVSLWCEVLQQVAGSRMLIMNSSIFDGTARERYLGLFAEHGIEEERVMMDGPFDHYEMLSSYAKIDIQLDLTPNSASITTLESLWMGVPVVTLPGELFSSRHSYSHLTNCGLPEFVASSRGEYIELAVALSMDLDRLTVIRSELRNKLNLSPICDGLIFTENFQEMLEQIWQRWAINFEASSAPDNTEAIDIYNSAIHVMENGDLSKAGELFLSVMQMLPQFLPAANNYAIVCSKLGRHEEAIEILRRLLCQNESFFEAHNNLGKIFLDVRKYADALECFESALMYNPNFCEALGNAGDALCAMGMIQAAEEAYRKAILVNPGHDHAYRKLGNLLFSRGEVSAAKDYYVQALTQNPASAETYNNLGNVEMVIGAVDEAFICYRKALEFAPFLSKAYSNMLLSMNYLSKCSQSDIYQASLKWHDSYLSDDYSSVLSDISPQRHDKIRIGYVSGDFRSHSVQYFIKPVLMHHDRTKFEIFCYSNVLKPDAVTIELSGLVDSWIDIASLTDAAVVKRIRDDGIDILVDLSGHTAGNRLGIFKEKSAATQITWLGYPNTSGLQEIDYRLTDMVTDQPGSEYGYSEKLIRLGDTFLCYQPPANIPSVAPSPFIRNGYVTFCSFNNLNKLSEEVIACWSRLMAAIPDARLMFKSVYCTDDAVCSRILTKFATFGVKKNRIRFFPFTNTVYEHLSHYGEADIALDSFPYNGTTTTFEALLMGVPVVTLAGDRHASRVGESILLNLGLSSLVGSSPQDYHEKVCLLTNDTEYLNQLRMSLRSRLLQSSWCNCTDFVSRLEKVYCLMIGQQSDRRP